MKKLFALLLVFMLACAASVAGLAAPTDQIVNDGGTVYYDADGKTTSGPLGGAGGAVVQMSKTIEQYKVGDVPVENEFVVTLNVKTQQNLLEISSDTPDSAVLLVMDVSNSMDDCVLCGKEESHSDHQGESEMHRYCNGTSGTEYRRISRRDSRCMYCGKYQSEHNEVNIAISAKCAYVSRLARTQTAAKDFLSEFANETGAQGDDKRMVGIVAYGSHAVNVMGYSDSTNWENIRTEAGMTAVMDAIDSLSVANTSYPDSLEGGGTSIESGLKLASNILNAGVAEGGELLVYNEGKYEPIDYVYTILLTDGQPTFPVSTGNYGINSSSVEYIYGNETSTGSSTQEEDYDNAEELATAIRHLNNNGLSKLYSICFGKKDGDPVWDLEVIGNDTVGEWLTSFSTAAYNAEAAQDANLFDAFNSVMAQIQLATKAWKVEDWMGEHMIMGEKVDVPNATNGTVFNAIDFSPSAEDYPNGAPAFVWDLLGSEPDPTSDYDAEHQRGTLSYTYKYRVTLDNLALSYSTTDGSENHPQNPAQAANAQATLRYAATNALGEWPSEYEVADFPVPQVRGLLGSLTFEKVDDLGQPIGAGWTFRLRIDHDNASASSETHWEYVDAVADGNGVVKFEGIPSGHDYRLIEAERTEAGAGYADAGDVKLSLDWGTFSGLTDGNDEDTYPELVNERLTKPATLVLEKDFTADNQVRPYGIQIQITGVGVNSGFSARRYLYQTDAKEDGIWRWELTGLKPGKYIVAEMNAIDHNGNFLREDHDLKYNVSVNGHNVYTDLQSFNGTNYPQIEVELGDDAKVAVRFLNEMTRKTGTLTLEKAFEGLAQGVATSGKQITVTATQVADANGTALTDAKTYTLPFTYANGKYTTSATLPIGFYKLEETVIPQLDGYTFQYVVFKNGTTSLGRTPVIEIKEGSAATLALTMTNSYTQDRGNIHVFKAFSGSLAQGDMTAEEYKTFLKENVVKKNDADEDGKPLVITVNVKQGDKIVGTMTISAGTDWAGELNNLPVGEYTLEEVDNNLDDVFGHKYNGHNWSVTGNKVTVTKGGIARATVTNHYDEAMTKLVVTKEFEHGYGMTDATFANKTIYVYVVQDDGNPDTYDVKDTLTLNAANSWMDSAVLPVGTYQLYEAISPANSNSAYVPGYTLVTEWTIGTQKISDGNIANIVLGDHDKQETPTVNVGLKNSYTVNDGTLTLEKKNIGDPTKAPESIVFEIVNVTDASDKRTVELNRQNSWGTSISLTPGTYKVTEVVAQGANPAMISWSGNVTGTTANTATVTITIGVNTVVDVICENDYYYQHKLTFKKLDIATRKPIKGVSFTLKHTANCCNFAIADMTATSDDEGVVTFEKVLGPHTYVLSEAEKEDYIAIAPMTVIATDKGVSITGITNGIVYNTPVKWPTVALSFTKISTFTGAPLEGVEFTLTHNRAGCEGVYHEGGEDVPMKAVSGANGLVSFSGIETGHTYTLTETKTPAGYNTIGALTVEVSSDKIITVTDENQNEVNLNGNKLENELTTWPTTNFGFAKYSSYTDEPLANVGFTLTHSAACTGCMKAPDAPITAKSGVNGSVWLANIPVGHTYILSETSIPTGYNPVADMTVVVAKDKTITVKDANGATISLQNGILYNDLDEWPTTTLTFTKRSSYDQAVIADAQFELVHVHDDNVEGFCCDTKMDVVLKATSGRWGEVKITGIPCNHAYVLKETVTPAGYKTMKDIQLGVNEEGKIFINDKEVEPNTMIVYNDLKIIPATLTLGAAKTMDGATPKDQYTFILSHEGTEIDRVQNVGGEVTFSPILFTAEGKTTFTITEEIGDDAKVLYDKSVYTVTVTAKKGANDILDLDIAIDKDGNTHNGAIEFHNETMQELPETGDNSKLGLWLALLTMASIGFVVLAKRKAVRG